MPQRRSGTLRWILTLVNGSLAIGLCGCGQTAESTAKVADASTVTFSRDVAPIVFAKCSTCHHPGEAAPFSLLTYDDVRRRARQIVEVTQSRFMPPWLPTKDMGISLERDG